MRISPIIVALDVETTKDVEKILRRLGNTVDFYKVGLKLFIHYGPEIIAFLKRRRKKVFLDLKLHDIPNTVAEACREAVRHRADLITVHASGGGEMMRAAVVAAAEEAKRRGLDRPYLMGVTVLTSMDSLKELGLPANPARQVLRLARLSYDSGLDGVICSPLEIKALRKKFPRGFKIVTPGVRPAGSATHDQKRVKTPQEAFQLGANAVVIGRPVLEAKDPAGLVRQILAG